MLSGVSNLLLVLKLLPRIYNYYQVSFIAKHYKRWNLTLAVTAKVIQGVMHDVLVLNHWKVSKCPELTHHHHFPPKKRREKSKKTHTQRTHKKDQQITPPNVLMLNTNYVHSLLIYLELFANDVHHKMLSIFYSNQVLKWLYFKLTFYSAIIVIVLKHNEDAINHFVDIALVPGLKCCKCIAC